MEINKSVAMSRLLTLRAGKATGVDEISPRLLSEIKNEVCDTLTIIFKK